MNQPKEEKSVERILSSTEFATWTTFPKTIEWLQEGRNLFTMPDKEGGSPNRYGKFDHKIKGINATIILLSAVCLEGFLIDSLKCFTAITVDPSDTSSPDYAFHKKLSSALTKDMEKLFICKLGKPFEDLINDESLVEGGRILFALRNQIAHSKSPIYYDCESGNIISAKFKDINQYLEENNFLKEDTEIFKNTIADHFASLIKPYMKKVLPLLPHIRSDTIKTQFKIAFKKDNEFQNGFLCEFGNEI